MSLGTNYEFYIKIAATLASNKKQSKYTNTFSHRAYQLKKIAQEIKKKVFELQKRYKKKLNQGNLESDYTNLEQSGCKCFI